MNIVQLLLSGGITQGISTYNPSLNDPSATQKLQKPFDYGALLT